MSGRGRGHLAGDYESCLWDFGDGNTSSVCADPSRVYPDVGIYSASLRVEGPGGVDTLLRPDNIVVSELFRGYLPAILRP
ncbi:MAG: PKD domain-containing protein [Candidatus Promineifilaceae bacterium]